MKLISTLTVLAMCLAVDADFLVKDAINARGFMADFLGLSSWKLCFNAFFFSASSSFILTETTDSSSDNRHIKLIFSELTKLRFLKEVTYAGPSLTVSLYVPAHNSEQRILGILEICTFQTLSRENYHPTRTTVKTKITSRSQTSAAQWKHSAASKPQEVKIKMLRHSFARRELRGSTTQQTEPWQARLNYLAWLICFFATTTRRHDLKCSWSSQLLLGKGLYPFTS